MDEFEGLPVVIFRLTDGQPVVPLGITVVGNDLVIPAILRPDLSVSRIAPQWAEAVDMSRGSAMIASVFTAYDEGGSPWGPSEMLTPEFDDALSDGPVGGFLLGQDFLQNVTLIFVGPARLVVLGVPPGDDASAEAE